MIERPTDTGNVIITGADGQDAHYLKRLLLFRGYTAIGVTRTSGLDITNFEKVEDLVKTFKPGYIFHFAAKSTVAHEHALENYATIATGALNLLEAAKRHAPRCRIFLPGSAYEFLNLGEPLDDNSPKSCDSVYCAARGFTRMLKDAYRREGLRVFYGFLFHHHSPKRNDRHVAALIAEAAREKKPIKLDHLNVEIEWTFAGDTVEAIWALVNQDTIWECCIGSGKTHTIAEFAEQCFLTVGRDWKEFVSERKMFLPKYLRCVSNPERINSIGWHPRHDIGYLADVMVKNIV